VRRVVGVSIRRIGTLAAGCLSVTALLACGGHAAASTAAMQRVQRKAIERYLDEVEPIRLAVNGLLEGADPTLAAFERRHIGRGEAARLMGELERRFAAYTVDVAAVDPSTKKLCALNAGYAATYVLEDAYLSALVVGLADDRLSDLPDTQAAQRAAIIRWRTGLTVLARTVGAPLPADLQQAGRGEIAPSLKGS
jgi:hypothetical protein